MSTLLGGVRLQGQLYLYNNILTKDILPLSLPNWLGETVCLTYLCSINRLIVTHKINDDYTYLSLLLSGQESGQGLYSGVSMISNTIYTPTTTSCTNITSIHDTTVASPISPPASQHDVSSNDIIIIQILCDSTNNKMYTLSSNGTLSITDLSPTLQQVRFTRRVIWGEGIPVNTVETYNQYNTWLQSYDIHTDIHTTHTTTPTHTTSNIHNTTNIHTNNTTNNNMRKTDLINISNEFCKLLAIIATTTGYSNVLFLDPLTGLIAVNMSIIHRSIVVLESSTLQRLYR